MGIFSSLSNRTAYVPRSDAGASPTLLTGADPNLILASGGSDPDTSSDGVQVAQQRPAPPRTPVPPTLQISPTERQLMAQPGRGYGTVSQDKIEWGMSPTQKSINRNQALLEIASQPPPSGAIAAPLSIDWRQEKSPDIVGALNRAAQRQDVPPDVLARQMYQEGKFNESIPLRREWDWTPAGYTHPVGLAQMTTQTFDELKLRAKDRGDLARAKELESYSPMDFDQAFDAAAEHLAYLHRRLGSWPAAVAAYNYKLDYVDKWLKGASGIMDPVNMKGTLNGRPYDRWREMTNYVANAFQTVGPNPQMGDMYAQRQSSSRYERGFKVAPPIVAPSVRTLHDIKENP